MGLPQKQYDRSEQMERALDFGLRFDSSDLEDYADGLLSDIADAIRDQVICGSHEPIDIGKAIKEIALDVEDQAEGWILENAE